MSVAAANGAVSTQQHQPTQEQIRLAQLIDDKKHDQPEVQEIVRKVLDVVTISNQDDALLALHDCDYDYERAVALLIEKGHEVASEWRTATNHKPTKKQQQQQQKLAATKNGHGGELDENGQQRGNDGFSSRGKSRGGGGRSRHQENGGDSQTATNQQQNDNYIPQQRQRGGNSYRGRNRGPGRGSFRGTDRNYHQQPQVQDPNADTSSPSDTNRRSRGGGAAPSGASREHQEQWDVGNWNGETLIYSRTAKDDEQLLNADDSSTVSNGQADINNQQQSKTEFDPFEAARQIKNVIGIGQTVKPLSSDQQQKSKTTGQPSNTKVTPPPPPRIPQQPVIFSDRYDGGVNKIDVQFGNLGEGFDESSPSSSSLYRKLEPMPANKASQRTNEQSSHVSPATRSSEQPVINQQLQQQQQQQHQQRILATQMSQQPSMTMKPVVTPQQYAVHQQQQMNAQNLLLQSLLYHHQHPPQQESVAVDNSYDPTAFSIQSIDLNSPYFMAPMNQAPPPLQQQQTQPRYLVSQPPPQQSLSKNAQAPAVATSTSGTTAKKAPAVPPGMFPQTGPPPLPQAAYSAAYGIQQPTGGATYSTPYDSEHLFTNAFMPVSNTQQVQSPSGAYGSVTPPVHQQSQPQQTNNNNNDNKTMNTFRAPLTENLMMLQQFQQFAMQQSSNQQQGQQGVTHSPAQLNYYHGHPPSGPSYSPGPQIMYAQAATAMPQQQQHQQQQQVPKQQGQQYNQKNSSAGIGGSGDDYYGRGSSSSSSSTNKEGQYMYAATAQPQHVSAQSTGQQQGVNKQQQQNQRPSGNVYNNQQGQQRSFQ